MGISLDRTMSRLPHLDAVRKEIFATSAPVYFVSFSLFYVKVLKKCVKKSIPIGLFCCLVVCPFQDIFNKTVLYSLGVWNYRNKNDFVKDSCLLLISSITLIL